MINYSFFNSDVSEDNGWVADVRLDELRDETRKIYYNAIEARFHINYLSESLERYSKASPREQVDIEVQIEPRKDIIDDNIEEADMYIERCKDKELSDPDEVALSLLVPYHVKSKEELSELEEELEETTLKRDLELIEPDLQY